MVNMRPDSPRTTSGDETENLIRLGCRKPSDDLEEDYQDAYVDGNDEINSLQRLAVCRLNNTPLSPRTRMEQEKRIRREIANSNERRRMQSINAGFQSLRALLPRKEGEKMSKAAILQQTSDMLQTLQAQKMELIRENERFKEQLEQRSATTSQEVPPPVCEKIEPLAPPKKRVRRLPTENNESSDEGLELMSDEPDSQPCKAEATPAACEKPWEFELIQRQLIELRLALDRERRMRLLLEDQLRQHELGRLQQSLGRLPGRLAAPNLLDYQPQTPSPLAAMPPVALAKAPPSIPAVEGPPPSAFDPFYQKALPPASASSKQSLEVIVEAIRHLEGDQLFIDVDSARPPRNVRTLNVISGDIAGDSGISSPIGEERHHVMLH